MSHLKIGNLNTDYTVQVEILCTSLQNKQITFLNDLTDSDTKLDRTVYNPLSFPVHYGLELGV